jgi:acyl carrier protein
MDDQRARFIIADHLAVRAAQVVEDAQFVTLGADSLDMISLTMRFEEEFNVRIPEDSVENCRTVGDCLALLRSCRVTA